MIDPNNEFLKEILENTFSDCNTNKEQYYWLVSMLHLLIGYPNVRKGRMNNIDVHKINERIYAYEPLINILREEYDI